MAHDKQERAYTAQAGAKALAKSKRQSEPFIQIPSLVLDSAAYADLSYSARAVLVEILYFYRGNNNGSIFLASSILNKRGIKKNTFTKALKELIAHGFIYQTRRGGSVSGVCSLFAITWKRINKADGQFLSQFVSNAYLNWKPSLEKNEGSEIGRVPPKNWEHAPKQAKHEKQESISRNFENSQFEKPVFPKSNCYEDMPYIGMNKHDLLKELNGETLDNWVQKNGVRLRKIGHINSLQTIH